MVRQNPYQSPFFHGSNITSPVPSPRSLPRHRVSQDGTLSGVGGRIPAQLHQAAGALQDPQVSDATCDLGNVGVGKNHAKHDIYIYINILYMYIWTTRPWFRMIINVRTARKKKHGDLMVYPNYP